MVGVGVGSGGSGFGWLGDRSVVRWVGGSVRESVGRWNPSLRAPQDWEGNVGYCRGCAGKCDVCGITMLRDEFNDGVWGNASRPSHPDRLLRCSTCPANQHKCGGCGKVKPSSDFNKTSLKNAQQRRKDSLKRCLVCRPSTKK